MFVAFAMMSFSIFALIRRTIRRIAAHKFSYRDSNNAAFLLIHADQPKTGKAILEQAMATGESRPIALSNYALSLALEGKCDNAKGVIDVLKYWLAIGTHEYEVVMFNECLIDALSGDRGGLDRLDRLCEGSKSLTEYKDASILVSRIKKQVGISPLAHSQAGA